VTSPGTNSKRSGPVVRGDQDSEFQIGRRLSRLKERILALWHSQQTPHVALPGKQVEMEVTRQCCGLPARNRRFWQHVEAIPQPPGCRITPETASQCRQKDPGAKPGAVKGLKLELFSAILEIAKYGVSPSSCDLLPEPHYSAGITRPCRRVNPPRR
jgi:hypothetical protein